MKLQGSIEPKHPLNRSPEVRFTLTNMANHSGRGPPQNLFRVWWIDDDQNLTAHRKFWISTNRLSRYCFLNLSQPPQHDSLTIYAHSALQLYLAL